MAIKKAPAKQARKPAAHHTNLTNLLAVIAAVLPGFTAPFVSEKTSRIIQQEAAAAGVVIGAIQK